jgi:hypothetical protein
MLTARQKYPVMGPQDWPAGPSVDVIAYSTQSSSSRLTVSADGLPLSLSQPDIS